MTWKFSVDIKPASEIVKYELKPQKFAEDGRQPLIFVCYNAN